MKSFAIFCLFLYLSCANAFMPLVFGENKKKSDHISAGKILEFSLQSLKQSLLKAIQQNDLLTFENATLQRDVQNLSRVRENLIIKKASLLGESPSFDYPNAQIPYMGFNDLEGRRQKAQDLIIVFERDVMVLKEKIQILEDKLVEKKHRSKKQSLLERKRRSQKNLLNVEKRLNYLNKKGEAPLGIINALKEEKRSLEYQVEMLEGTLIDL